MNPAAMKGPMYPIRENGAKHWRPVHLRLSPFQGSTSRTEKLRGSSIIERRRKGAANKKALLKTGINLPVEKLQRPR